MTIKLIHINRLGTVFVMWSLVNLWSFGVKTLQLLKIFIHLCSIDMGLKEMQYIICISSSGDEIILCTYVLRGYR